MSKEGRQHGRHFTSDNLPVPTIFEGISGARLTQMLVPRCIINRFDRERPQCVQRIYSYGSGCAVTSKEFVRLTSGYVELCVNVTLSFPFEYKDFYKGGIAVGNHMSVSEKIDRGRNHSETKRKREEDLKRGASICPTFWANNTGGEVNIMLS